MSEVVGTIGLERNGDDHLSAVDRRLWDITYHVLLTYGVPVMFKYFGGSSPGRIDRQLDWFIPVASGKMFDEIKNFIRTEFWKECGAGQDIKLSEGEAFYMAGLHVNIYPFSGFSAYIDREKMEKMAHDFMKMYMFGVPRNVRIQAFLYGLGLTSFRLGMIIGAVTIAFVFLFLK